MVRMQRKENHLDLRPASPRGILEDDLLTELLAARNAMDHAAPECAAEARLRFARVLGRFSSVVLDNEVLDAADPPTPIPGEMTLFPRRPLRLGD